MLDVVWFDYKKNDKGNTIKCTPFVIFLKLSCFQTQCLQALPITELSVITG